MAAVYFLLLLIVLYFFMKPGKKTTRKSAAGNSLKSVSEIAASIVTAKDFVSLLKQVEKAEEKMYEADTDKKEETAKQKFELLSEALESASSKTYLWKFSPGISLETPSLELEHAGMVK